MRSPMCVDGYGRAAPQYRGGPARYLDHDGRFGYGISKRKVTVSTAGVVPGIERLMTETDVSLAISACPVDELRN